MPDGGRLAVMLAAQRGQAVLSVADSRPGVPVAQRTAIVERFHRDDLGISQRVGGAGLGLSVAREFLELQGDRL